MQAAGLFHRIDASGNAGIGLNVLSHSAVTGCNATANGQSGIDGNDDCTISDCVASLNTGTGIQIGTGSVRGCTARQNSGKGIYALTGVEIVQCSATYNMQGGIYAGIGGSVQNCTAFLNHGWGINTVPGCTVSGCTVRENEGDGIVAYAAVDEMSELEWDAMIDVNLKGPFLVARSVIPVMKAQRSGVIINNSSVSAILPTRSTCLTIRYLRLTVARSMFFEAPKTSLMILNSP